MSRTLPHNPEAEASVLGGVLLRNDALNDIISVLKDDDFYIPRHQAIFKAMMKLAERGQPVDVVTLEHQLKAVDELGLVGGIEELAKLADRYSTAHNIEHHAELIKEAAIVRNLVITSQSIAEEGRSEIEDVGEFIDDAERRILEVNQRGRKNTMKPVGDLLRGVFEKITYRAKLKNPITGVPSGFRQLDLMTGGLQPSDLIILAARPSMGKTALALNVAQHCCITEEKHANLPEDQRPPKFPVLIFSLEMSAEQLVERMLCSEARVDAGALRESRWSEEYFRKLVRAADRVHRAPLYIDDTAAPSILEIRARCRRFRQDKSIFPSDVGPEGHGPPLGMIMVDYLQLCRGSKNYDMREQEISEISRGLKAIAKELQLPVIALSQLNRAVDSRADHRPMLSDLRESGAIEQDADVIMFIYREERYLTAETPESERQKVAGKAELIIGKQRNGPIGTVNLSFVGKYTRFENPTEHAGPPAP